MNDVLAKPFTKEGMVRILKKHLHYMLKNPLPPEELAANGGGPGSYPMGGPASLSSSGGGGGGAPGSTGGKFDTTPIQSPATSSSWHWPGQMHTRAPTWIPAGAAGTWPCRRAARSISS